MTRYLEALIAQARGAEPEMKPRLRSRFEPMTGAPEPLPSDDIDNAPAPAPADIAAGTTGARPAQIASGEPRQPHSDQPPQEFAITVLKQETRTDSERIERVERQVVERITGASLPIPPPQITVVAERSPRPAPPEQTEALPARLEAERRTAEAEPDRAERPRFDASAVPSERPPRRDDGAPAHTTAATPAFAFSPQPAHVTERRDIPETQEITISIGVIDIRLMPETPAAGHRPPRSATPERRSDVPDLSEYLARRSGPKQ
jgi:hypothetical protein